MSLSQETDDGTSKKYVRGRRYAYSSLPVRPVRD
jgi:hypothetical protein